MNEKETFGVEIELITQKFSQKMEEMKSKINNFGKIAKQNFQTGMYMDINQAKEDLKNYESELEKLSSANYEWNILDNNEVVDVKNRINTLKILIDDLKNDINAFETSKISKLGSSFSDIVKIINKLKNTLNGTKKDTNKFEKNIKSSFENGIKSIKKFTLSLFGIQSIWRAVSRASSAYLSQDVELSNKLQAVWVGLGSLLSPILEKLANFFLKMVGYLNVFVKSLTGVDLLAKAMKKANDNTKATTKSTKELKGQLSGFDEINNIADNENSGASVGGGDTNWASAFDNVKLDTSWTEKIQNFGSWVKDNWPTVIGLISGTVLAIELIKLGVSGLKSLSIGLMLAGIVMTISSIVAFIKDPSWTNFANILTGLAVILAGVAVAMIAVNAANPVAWIVLAIAAVIAFAAIIVKNWDAIKEAISNGCKKVAEWFKGLWESIKSIFGKVAEWFTGIFGDAFSGIKKVFSGFKQYFSGIKDVFVGIFTLDKNKICTGLKNVIAGVGNILMGFIEGIINGFLIPINGAISLINKIPGVNIPKLHVTMPKFPKLATGTNYVPSDQLAYIHQGEAVIPKKFNSREYFGNGNGETNELLRELIEVIDNKDYTFNLDGKEIGRTAKTYINNQNRIMGVFN